MAKTKSTPGPKPTYGPRKDYHIKLPYDLAEAFEKRAGQFGGVIKYVEHFIRKDLGEQLPEGKESSMDKTRYTRAELEEQLNKRAEIILFDGDRYYYLSKTSNGYLLTNSVTMKEEFTTLDDALASLVLIINSRV